MEKILVLAFAVISMISGSAQAVESQCESDALMMAKAIRSVEMPRSSRGAKFRVVSSDVSDESETYTVEMRIRGKKTMTDQRLVMVGGERCVLAFYDMPGAG